MGCNRPTRLMFSFCFFAFQFWLRISIIGAGPRHLSGVATADAKDANEASKRQLQSDRVGGLQGSLTRLTAKPGQAGVDFHVLMPPAHSGKPPLITAANKWG